MFMDSVMMIFTTDSTSTEKGFEIHYTTEGKYKGSFYLCIFEKLIRTSLMINIYVYLFIFLKL